jgi:hypothetical protein
MYSLALVDGLLLALAVLAVAFTLIFGVLVGFPRTLQTLTAGVGCPVVRRGVEAELVRDAWTLRGQDVRRCAVLGGRVDLCAKGCV